ncbi:HD-domain/PDEase-like protein [Gloeophyllum trabeum ATCC 11539]|uniref:HD-domain/PDEase-like protein n=1 Tax=Gloeophyllum trabeum (strain ATCC 11539 / FP-39264 / Madison 617) TaxID=670483 RepID=S7PXN5_GLOTA|nr:HD-domain/PDEase-like protein [Gloeophyllum trabeum ATCC 11539]EPQ52062.1 HD-domain/PDEase-like protein [Gloeophyllum trabeum ATCC 11539]
MCKVHGNLGIRDSRRRSVDVGGLALALAQEGLGHGWGGWEDEEIGEARYAELLSDMYTHTQSHTSADSAHGVISEMPLTAEARRRLIRSLDSWNFEPHKLPDEEIIACTLILFESLYRMEGMQEDLSVPLQRLSDFLHHLRHVYRQQNSYHNFHHALDVLQATHIFLHSSNIVPPVSILLNPDDGPWRPNQDVPRDPLLACLTNEDLFALYVAAIGHDAGHPGFTNNFMKNAKTPLSMVYDDRSALEQMHCALLLKLMRNDGLGHLLDRPVRGPQFRRLLLQTVLATDMSVHPEFMDLFKNLLAGKETDVRRQKVLICQALIKCADISNPCRPMSVSRHWAAALAQEWQNQALLERHLDLPLSVQPSVDPLSEARSQVWFINTFAKPLFDMTASGVPEMAKFALQCSSNLQTWEARCAELNVHEDAALEDPERSATPARMPEDFLTVFPLTLPSDFLLPQMLTTVGAVAPSSPPATPSEYSASSIVSPQSEVFDLLHPQNSTYVGGNSAGSDANAAIRAAYKASVRKKKSFHRNSWNPSGAFSAPHPAVDGALPMSPRLPCSGPPYSSSHAAPPLLVARYKSAS